MSDWQPIDTAPRDTDEEAWVLLFGPKFRKIGRYYRTERWERDRYASTADREVTERIVEEGWQTEAGGLVQATHWMPLPEPPK